MSTVKRTYYTKSKGWVTKYYTYEYKERRGGKNLTLVGKSGRVYKDRVSEILDQIEDTAIKADARALIARAKREGDKITVRGLAAKLTDDRYEKMLINAGYSKELFEKETGITFEEFSKKENWRTDDMGKWTFTSGGRSYKYVHRYEGSILV